MRVLGVDPGLGITGYGVVERSENGRLRVLEAGVIRTAARRGIGGRLERIYRGLDGLVTEHRPGALALEKLYSHYRHPASVIAMSHARGVICLLAGMRRIPLINYPSTRIKKAITGNGMASKTQVQRMIQNLLCLDAVPEPPDVADALAIAVSHLYIEQKRGLS